jgi:hypothetical protein
MKRAVLYLRVSTLDQTTANQERELRQVAERAKKSKLFSRGQSRFSRGFFRTASRRRRRRRLRKKLIHASETRRCKHRVPSSSPGAASWRCRGSGGWRPIRACAAGGRSPLMAKSRRSPTSQRGTPAKALGRRLRPDIVHTSVYLPAESGHSPAWAASQANVRYASSRSQR